VKIVVERTRILLLIPRLHAGGAEQVMALVARGLSREKYDVHLGLVMEANAKTAEMPEWVTIHALGAKRARAGALPLLRLVWRLRPAVILSGAPEISFLVLLLRQFFPSAVHILVRQNGTVSAALSMGGVPRYTRLLYRLLYCRADRIICQSRAMAEDLVRELEIDLEKIVVLPNPVDLEGIYSAKNGTSVWQGPGPHLLAVGRLSREKGFDLLLEAIASVRKRFSTITVIIAGAGREEAQLKNMCRTLGLERTVRFVGRVDRPYDYFPGATLFVLSSRCEGMPNALLEAAAAGLPLVATPASGGVVELLRGKPGAWLAASISSHALFAALIAALEALHPGQRFCHEFFPSQAGRYCANRRAAQSSAGTVNELPRTGASV
jgi:glycosyltransferase involved in cell wall biosynthesis